ncbi:hypothetical protein L2E82_03561 [Cichorium intybus]|uniref:Uncharacterized protein n=1 Tax=Cichorium intybus TaxID=13427 RepID=A0ACB9H4N7_CICIN|nr:hypothetical protein L2E82_03561 [Cichorium intybus]
MLENHHREFIKQTMLKHEDTFRHQVRELHRLYDVQKSMMGTLRNDNRRNTELGQPATLDINSDDLAVGFDLSRPAKEDTSCGDSSGIHEDQTGPNDVELTLSIGPSGSKRRSQNCLHQTGGNNSKATMKSNLVNSSTLYNQDKKKPHWLFQDLSLNRT